MASAVRRASVKADLAREALVRVLKVHRARVVLPLVRALLLPLRLPLLATTRREQAPPLATTRLEVELLLLAVTLRLQRVSKQLALLSSMFLTCYQPSTRLLLQRASLRTDRLRQRLVRSPR